MTQRVPRWVMEFGVTVGRLPGYGSCSATWEADASQKASRCLIGYQYIHVTS